MKKLSPIVEVEGEGLVALLNETITLFCMNYIYTGKLEGVNETCVKLTDAFIVYETGSFPDAKWKDAQKLPFPIYVQLSSIEMFTTVDKKV